MKKNPLTLWLLVGICFFIIVLAWAPIAFRRINELSSSLSKQTKKFGGNIKGLSETQIKEQFEGIANKGSAFASSTPQDQVVSRFSEQLKIQLLQNASSSSTTPPQ